MDGNDVISEDSSFYGDDELKQELEDRAAAFDPEPYWTKIHPFLPAVISWHRCKEMDARQAQQQKEAYNRFEGNTSARQLTESVEDFLHRLLPSSTTIDHAGPWLYVADPKSDSRPLDEHLGPFREAGQALLASFNKEKAVGRILTEKRRKLEADIFAVAQEHGITSGKWMLFPQEDKVDAAWSKIAHATVEGGLGFAAKVATNHGAGDGSRLICVYTVNYQDRDDVKRVLIRLAEMGLISAGSGSARKVLYYKADALTYLDINSGNPYGLKASLYSSTDLFKAAR